jgi:hypothetical protein
MTTTMRGVEPRRGDLSMATAVTDAFRTRTIARISWRLLPLIIVSYLVAYIDRTNVAFAALTMNKDLAISSYIYGLGAGIFFVGYALFEVPSNMVLERVGARRWIARIMITWSIISALMALTTGPVSFLVLRFLLGVAEAGFFPGILFSVKGREIKECYEAKAMEKIVHLKETSDKYAKEQQPVPPPSGGSLDAYLRGIIERDRVADNMSRQEQFRKFVDRTEHEAKRLRILAEHIESDRIYYLTESQLVEIGLLPGLR